MIYILIYFLRVFKKLFDNSIKYFLFILFRLSSISVDLYCFYPVCLGILSLNSFSLQSLNRLLIEILTYLCLDVIKKHLCYSLVLCVYLLLWIVFDS